MTQTYTAANRVYEKLRYYNSNYELIQTQASTTLAWRDFVEDAPPSHRPFPSGDPRLSPTAQPLQFKRRMKEGIMESDYLPYYTLFKKVQDPVLNEIENMSVFPTELDWQTKMRLDIKDFTTNLGTSVIEYRQTASMFEDFAKGAASAYRSFRRGKRPKGKRFSPCTVAAAELTASYGLEPLANDLFDSYMSLKHKLEEPILKRFISKKREEGSTVISNRGDIEIEWEMSQRAICYVRLNPNFNQFTLGNPAELAWEVVPFSFVVDWAIPIGDTLSALDALKTVERVIGTVTTKRKYQHNFVHEKILNGDRKSIIPATLDYEDHSRAVIYSIPLPRVPTWDPSQSWRAVQHGLSLLTTLNKRCNRKPGWR